ncbi:hypothetical protein GCM10009720_12550 [Yaniella flava]|uniref:NlpC/P60 domain-containing protein n=1 Tax=Yaniella flava TaxID=287930 RepID=A0ABN2UD34_9MICC
MKSRSVKGAAAGVALVTVAAMSATAMPQIFSESDTFFAGSNDASAPSLTEVPDLPDEETVAAAKDNPDAQAKLREDLKEILDKSNQRLADAEGQTLSTNEKARELNIAAADARRDAETASQQAELASADNEEAQENAGEAAADMYRNGGLSTEEFMLGDEDALRAEQNGQQVAEGLTGQAGNSQYQDDAQNAVADNEDDRAQAAKDAAEQAEAEAEAEQQRLVEEEAQREREEQEAQQQRMAVAAALEETNSEETVEDLDDEVRSERFEENAGVSTASNQTSPTDTSSVSEAPVTPTPSETATEEETESASPSETATPSPTPTETSTSTPSSTPSSTPTQSSTPSSTPSATPTQTATPTPTPTRTATPTPTPTPTPTQTTPPPSSGGNMSAAVNWAVNKTNEAGTSYVWGGNGPKGYDCSGFTVAAFAQSGKSLPRQSSAQFGAAKQYVSLDNLQAGDLVFWSNNGSGSGVYHVAIYIGNGQIAHARNPSTGISITSLHYSPYNMMSVGGRY